MIILTPDERLTRARLNMYNIHIFVHTKKKMVYVCVYVKIKQVKPRRKYIFIYTLDNLLAGDMAVTATGRFWSFVIVNVQENSGRFKLCPVSVGV